MSAAKRAIDPIAVAARKLGYVARSALKLVELDDKFRLLRSKSRILDLGCAPGAWIQACCARGEKHTEVLGVDLQDVELSGMRYIDEARVRTLVRDAHEATLNELGGAHSFDLILSDMMANTSGIASVDAAASLHLAECAVDVAMSRGGGELVVKILEGDGSVGALVAACKPRFAKLNWFKPKATRSESKEIYLVARGRTS
jgi:23S rRNA (uridine2552-2'-O)-methyltransferase